MSKDIQLDLTRTGTLEITAGEAVLIRTNLPGTLLQNRAARRVLDKLDDLLESIAAEQLNEAENETTTDSG